MAKLVSRLNLARNIEQGDLNPVGMIVHSMLDQAQFQSLNGSSWVLAQGQSVAGSKYATLTGQTTLPDCRGEFIRGLDNGRGVDAGRVKGTAQANGFGSHNHGGGSHSHSINAYGGGGAGVVVQYALGGGLVGYPNSNGPSVTVVATEGNTTNSNETRPRNIAMNIFIKIN